MNHTKLIVFYIVWCLADISNCTPIKTKNEDSGNCDNSCKVGFDYGSGSHIEDIEIGSRRSRQSVRDLGYIKQIFRSRRDLDTLDTPVDEPSPLDKSDTPINEPNDADETTVGSPNVSDNTQNTPDSPADEPNILDGQQKFVAPDGTLVVDTNTSDDPSNTMDKIFDTIEVRSLDTRDDKPNISDDTKNTPDNIADISEEAIEEVSSTSMAGDSIDTPEDPSEKLHLETPMTDFVENPITPELDDTINPTINPSSDDEGGRSVNGEITSAQHDTLNGTPDETPIPNAADDTTVGTVIASDEAFTSLNSRSSILDDIPNAANDNKNTSGDTVDTSEKPSDDEGGKSVNGETIGTPQDTLDGTPDETPIPNAPDDTTVGTVIASDEAFSSLNSRSNILDNIPNAADDNKNTSGDTSDTLEEPSDDEGGKSVNGESISTTQDNLDGTPDETPIHNALDDTTVGTAIASNEAFSSLNSRSSIIDDIPNAADDNKNTSGDTVDTSEEPSDDEGGKSVNGETIGTPQDTLDGTPDETPIPNAPGDTTVGTVIASDEAFSSLNSRSNILDDIPNAADDNKNTSDTLEEPSDDESGKTVIGESISTTQDNLDGTPDETPIHNALDDTTVSTAIASNEAFSSLNSRSSILDDIHNAADDIENTSGDTIDTWEEPSPMSADFVENSPDNKVLTLDTLKGSVFEDKEPYLIEKLDESSNNENGESVSKESSITPNNSEDTLIDEPSALDTTSSTLNSRSNMQDDIPNTADETKSSPDVSIDILEEPSEGVIFEPPTTTKFVENSISLDLENKMPEFDTLQGNEFGDLKSLVKKLDEPSNDKDDKSVIRESVSTPNTSDDTFNTLNSRSMNEHLPNISDSDDTKRIPDDVLNTSEEPFDGVIPETSITDGFAEKPLLLVNKIPTLNPLKGNEFDDSESIVTETLDSSKDENEKSVSTLNTSDTPSSADNALNILNSRSNIPEDQSNTSGDAKTTPDDEETLEEPFNGLHSATSMNGDVVDQSIFTELDNRMLDSDDTANTSDCTTKIDSPDSTTKVCDDTPNTSEDPKNTSDDTADALEKPFEGLHFLTPGPSGFVENPIPPTMPIAEQIPMPTLNHPKRNEFGASELLFGENGDGESISTSSTNEDINTPNTSDSAPVSTPNTSGSIHDQISKSNEIPNISHDIKVTPEATVDNAEETYEGVHFSPTTGDIIGNPLPPGRENKMPTLNPPKTNEFDALELLFIEKLENFSKLKIGKNYDGESISTPSTNEDINTPNTSDTVPVSTPDTSDSLRAQISKSNEVPIISDDIKVRPETTLDPAEEIYAEGVHVSPTTGGIVDNSLPPGRDNKMPANQPSRKECNELESLFVGKLHELESSFFEKISDFSNHENCKIALGESTNVRNEFDELELLFLEKLHELEASFIGILNDFSNLRSEKISIDESTSVRNEFDELELLFIKKLEEFSNQRNGQVTVEQSFTDNIDNRDFHITPFHIQHQVEDNHDGNLDYIMKHILPELEQKIENIKYLPIYREVIGETEVEAENRFNNDKYESNISPCPCHITFDDDHVFQKQQELQNIEDDLEMPMYPSYDSDDFRSNNFPLTDSPLTCDDLDYFY